MENITNYYDDEFNMLPDSKLYSIQIKDWGGAKTHWLNLNLECIEALERFIEKQKQKLLKQGE